MNYLIVTKYLNIKLIVEKIRRVKAQGKKGQALAREYEKELNGGKEAQQAWNEHWDEWTKAPNSQTYKEAEVFNVVYIPYSQARDYRNFSKWEDAPEFKSKKKKGEKDDRRREDEKEN